MSKIEEKTEAGAHSIRAELRELLRVSNLTPQEAAVKADLHINTVKKILAGEKTHPNSVTKLNRALVAAKNLAAVEIVDFDSHPSASANSDLVVSAAFAQLVMSLEDKIASAKENQAEFLETDLDALWVDLDRVEGLLQIFEKAQNRLRRR